MAELTVYPEAGEGGGNVSNDTFLTGSLVGEFEWAQVVNQASANTDQGNVATATINWIYYETNPDEETQVQRFVATFDTTPIGAGDVTAVIFSLYHPVGGTIMSIYIASFVPADFATIGVVSKVATNR